MWGVLLGLRFWVLGLLVSGRILLRGVASAEPQVSLKGFLKLGV